MLCFTTDDVNLGLDHLVKTVSGILHYKVTHFTLYLIYNLGEIEIIQISCFSSTFFTK